MYHPCLQLLGVEGTTKIKRHQEPDISPTHITFSWRVNHQISTTSIDDIPIYSCFIHTLVGSMADMFAY